MYQIPWQGRTQDKCLTGRIKLSCGKQNRTLPQKSMDKVGLSFRTVRLLGYIFGSREYQFPQGGCQGASILLNIQAASTSPVHIRVVSYALPWWGDTMLSLP